MRSAGHILHRTDAVKLMGVLRARGHTDVQIAASLTERFAELLGDGQRVTRGMVGGRRRRDEQVRAVARKLQVTILMRQGLTRAEAHEQID